jgi:hypothetical protein
MSSLLKDFYYFAAEQQRLNLTQAQAINMVEGTRIREIGFDTDLSPTSSRSSDKRIFGWELELGILSVLQTQMETREVLPNKARRKLDSVYVCPSCLRL